MCFLFLLRRNHFRHQPTRSRNAAPRLTTENQLCESSKASLQIWKIICLCFGPSPSSFWSVFIAKSRVAFTSYRGARAGITVLLIAGCLSEWAAGWCTAALFWCTSVCVSHRTEHIYFRFHMPAGGDCNVLLILQRSWSLRLANCRAEGLEESLLTL